MNDAPMSENVSTLKPRRVSRGVSRNLTRCGWAVMVLFMTLSARTPPAVAGTYVIRSCNVPGKSAAPVGPWRSITARNTYANDECASGGGFGISAGPMDRGTVAAVVVDGLGERPISIRRVRLWMIARLSGSGSALFVAWSAGGPAGTTASADLFAPPGGETLTVPFETPVLAADTKAFVVNLSCSGDTPYGCAPSSVDPLEIRGAELTLQEDVPPAGAITGGSLLGDRGQEGVQRIEYALHDAESGITQVTALLGTTVVGIDDVTAACGYASYAACPAERAGGMSIDTRKVPNGSYPLTLRVMDAAGNQGTILLPKAVKIDNADPLTPNGVNATGDARLTASFAGVSRRAITVPFNRHVIVRGRVVTAAGVPISKARVEVVEAPTLRRLPPTIDTVTTRADGTFRYRLRARGMSRVVRIQYRASLEGPAVAAAQRLQLNVAAAARLTVSLRGIQVRYGGRVISRPVPRRGTQVYLQGRAVGGAWTTFAVKRTDRGGRFSGTYRLRVRRPGVRLQFRVRVPRQSGYPYARGTGVVVTRTVR